MLQKADFVRLFEYTVWANHRAMRASALLTVADFRKDLGSSYGGVRGTLVHMLAAEWIWLERWKGISPTRFFDESEFPDVIALRERWVAIEEHRAVWLRELPKNGPTSKVRYKNVKGEVYEAPLWQLVQHLANHSTYHRGQVTTLLRLLGARPVGTDLLTWDRESVLRKARSGE
jgi:uncharacterized damage-inducible protein DinB